MVAAQQGCRGIAPPKYLLAQAKSSIELLSPFGDTGKAAGMLRKSGRLRSAFELADRHSFDLL